MGAPGSSLPARRDVRAQLPLSSYECCCSWPNAPRGACGFRACRGVCSAAAPHPPVDRMEHGGAAAPRTLRDERAGTTRSSPTRDGSVPAARHAPRRVREAVPEQPLRGDGARSPSSGSGSVPGAAASQTRRRAHGGAGQRRHVHALVPEQGTSATANPARRRSTRTPAPGQAGDHRGEPDEGHAGCRAPERPRGRLDQPNDESRAPGSGGQSARAAATFAPAGPRRRRTRPAAARE